MSLGMPLAYRTLSMWILNMGTQNEAQTAANCRSNTSRATMCAGILNYSTKWAYIRPL